MDRALLVLLAAAATPAQAACDAASRYNFSFASQASSSQDYAASYSYTATNAAAQGVTFSVAFAANGLTTNVAAGVALPAIGTLVSSGGGNTLSLGGVFAARTADIAGAANVIAMTVTFPAPVRDVTISVHDIDFTTNQFRDWMHATGRSGAGAYVPALVTPFGQANQSGPFAAAASSLTLGPVATPVAVTASQAAGTGSNANTDPGGDVTVSFAQPVTSVELRYGNYPLQSGELVTGQQAIGIQTISFCPMPAIAVSKTAAPFVSVAGDPKRFAIPGADMLYSVTVTNSGGSPVDTSTIALTDALPGSVAFFNGDIDGGGPLTGSFEFVAGGSGLTLAAAGYSNNNGASYAYSPASGYDNAVNGLRFAPSGVMAANSSFTIRYRARIN